MNSLVAYDTSSDEESENEESVSNDNFMNSSSKVNDKTVTSKQNNSSNSSKSVELSNLSNSKTSENNNREENLTTSLFNKLPQPKTFNSLDIQEEDDEFLHKKATPNFAEKRPKGPVQITIPSLSQFKDMDEDGNKSKVKFPQNPKGSTSCGLLDLLPKPKVGAFSKSTSFPSTSSIGNPFTSSQSSNPAKLIPDSVKNKSQSNRKSQNTATVKKKKPQNLLRTEVNDSDESDENEDFFSLNSANDDKLPEVSVNEINAMVAKRAAKMAEVASKLNDSLNPQTIEEDPKDNSMESNSTSQEVNIDEKAIQILVGSRAKRRKVEEVNVVELSSEQVLPNKDEWLRTALASSTQYQPKGVLIDEEPVPGTRRKHQITYLAHQAKANELELQAMWAANRQSRRQTQSKYGF